MDLSYKSVPFELTEVKDRGGDGWSFAGYASTFGNVDLGGDIVVKGAFRESLGQRRPRLLWQHDMHEPIGVVSNLKEDDRGLFGEFKLSKTARGADAYQLLKDGAVDSMSIGYVPTDVEYDDEQEIRRLKSVDLLEISVVSMPMNELAIVTSVKNNLPFDKHASLVLDGVQRFADRYREVLRLRAEKGRLPGEEARRVVTELKALVAGLEVPTASDVSAPAKSLGATTLRLELARRRFRHRGILEQTA